MPDQVQPYIPAIAHTLEDLSERMHGDKSIVVAYDNDSSWPMTWYLREYPNRIYFGDTPGRNILDAPVVIVGSNNWGAVDIKDSIIIDFDYAELKIGNTNFLAAKSHNKWEWGFINEKNDTVLEFMYEDATAFINGVAAVKKEEKYGIINHLGETVVPFEFDNIEILNDEIITVYQEEKYGFYGRPHSSHC